MNPEPLACRACEPHSASLALSTATVMVPASSPNPSQSPLYWPESPVTSRAAVASPSKSEIMELLALEHSLTWQVPAGTHSVPHTCCPSGHWHAPATHAALAGHAVPQPPQWAELVIVSTQAPPHEVCPSGHSQAPPVQDKPAAQGMLQPPQWSTSVIVLTHEPPQFSRPSAQLSEHMPSEQ